MQNSETIAEMEKVEKDTKRGKERRERMSECYVRKKGLW